MTWQLIAFVATMAIWTVAHHALSVMGEAANTTKVRIGTPMGHSKSWEGPGIEIPSDIIHAWAEDRA